MYRLDYYYIGSKNDSWNSSVQSHVESKLTEWGIGFEFSLDQSNGDFHILGWNIDNIPSTEQYIEILSYIHTNISTNINQY